MNIVILNQGISGKVTLATNNVSDVEALFKLLGNFNYVNSRYVSGTGTCYEFEDNYEFTIKNGTVYTENEINKMVAAEAIKDGGDVAK